MKLLVDKDTLGRIPSEFMVSKYVEYDTISL